MILDQDVACHLGVLDDCLLLGEKVSLADCHEFYDSLNLYRKAPNAGNYKKLDSILDEIIEKAMNQK